MVYRVPEKKESGHPQKNGHGNIQLHGHEKNRCQRTIVFNIRGYCSLTTFNISA